jgi:hypothetical protein
VTTAPLPRPAWATDYTPRLPDCIDPARPHYTVEVHGWSSDPGHCGCPYGWPYVGQATRPVRRPWWWPFGVKQWVTEYYFQAPEEPIE